MNYAIYYLGGSKNFLEPMKTRLKIKKSGLELGIPPIKTNREFIPWDRVLKVELTSQLADKRVSYGKAIGGALLFGPVGAILGGLSGKKVNERQLTIVYLNEQNELSGIHLEADRTFPLIIKKNIEKELTARFGTADRTEA